MTTKTIRLLNDGCYWSLSGGKFPIKIGSKPYIDPVSKVSGFQVSGKKLRKKGFIYAKELEYFFWDSEVEVLGEL